MTPRALRSSAGTETQGILSNTILNNTNITLNPLKAIRPNTTRPPNLKICTIALTQIPPSRHPSDTLSHLKGHCWTMAGFLPSTVFLHNLEVSRQEVP